MKKRLLITLGCSITEGVGCYDYKINPNQEEFYKLQEPFYSETLTRFHTYAWPNLVGKALGFNKVINLGAGGSSNSTHLKLFVDKILPDISKLQEEYEIFLIWMMTEPTRFSFYSRKHILLYNPTVAGVFEHKTMESAYINDMPEIKIGPIREQIFLMKVAEQMFRGLNLNYILTSWVINFPMVYSFYKTPNFLSPKPFAAVPSTNPRFLSSVCTHPNEKGYEYIADVLIKKIEKFHPNFISKNIPKTFEWEWKGSTEYGIESLPESKILF